MRHNNCASEEPIGIHNAPADADKSVSNDNDCLDREEVHEHDAKCYEKIARDSDLRLELSVSKPKDHAGQEAAQRLNGGADAREGRAAEVVCRDIQIDVVRDGAERKAYEEKCTDNRNQVLCPALFALDALLLFNCRRSTWLAGRYCEKREQRDYKQRPVNYRGKLPVNLGKEAVDKHHNGAAKGNRAVVPAHDLAALFFVRDAIGYDAYRGDAYKTIADAAVEACHDYHNGRIFNQRKVR